MIADGKRGDISVSAAAYAQALVGSTPTPFGEVAGLGADAFTANPLLGVDALEPLVGGARAAGAGVFVLVRTSNPGAADVEDLELAGGGGHRLGAPGGDRRAARRAAVGASGLSDIGAVVGATAPEHVARMRELMPHAPFLLPGIGAQGGRVEDLAPAFAPGRAGGLVSASRSIAARARGSRRRAGRRGARGGRAPAGGRVVAGMKPRDRARSTPVLQRATLVLRAHHRRQRWQRATSGAQSLARLLLGPPAHDGDRRSPSRPTSPRRTPAARVPATSRHASSRSRRATRRRRSPSRAGSPPSGCSSSTPASIRGALQPGQTLKLAP